MIPKTENPRPLINIPATRGKTSPYSALDCSNLSVLSGAKSKPRPMSTRYDPKYSRLNLVLFRFTSHTPVHPKQDLTVAAGRGGLANRGLDFVQGKDRADVRAKHPLR